MIDLSGEGKMRTNQRIKRGIKGVISLLKEKQVITLPTYINKNELLQGKTALIVGGSGGIGFAMVESFLKSGCKVVLAGTSERKLKDCTEKLREWGGRNWPLLLLMC